MTSDPFFPSITMWQIPAVTPGENVAREQLIAAGVTRIFYPSSIWLFIPLIPVLGITMGVGSSAVHCLIPDQLPAPASPVGGSARLPGGLGGFNVAPILS